MKTVSVPQPLVKGQKITAAFLNQLLLLCRENRVEASPPLRSFSGVDFGTRIEMDVNTGAATNPIFPVALTKTSGSAGDATNYCSYVYTVKDLRTTPNTLATGAAPLNSRARIAKGPCDEATKGTAYYGTTGVLVLWDADEVHQTGTC